MRRKLDCVAADVMSKSGRDMLDALVAGTTDPEVLAQLARRQMRKKIPRLREALEGHFDAHHAVWIGAILAHIDFLDEQIDRLSDAIKEQLRPCAAAVELLCTIVGIQHRGAQCILAEIGTDMTRFASARHLASWAGQCPGNDHSAGKRRSGKTRNGSKWLDCDNQTETRAVDLVFPIDAETVLRRVRHGVRGRLLGLVELAGLLVEVVNRLEVVLRSPRRAQLAGSGSRSWARSRAPFRLIDSGTAVCRGGAPAVASRGALAPGLQRRAVGSRSRSKVGPEQRSTAALPPFLIAVTPPGCRFRVVAAAPRMGGRAPRVAT